MKRFKLYAVMLVLALSSLAMGANAQVLRDADFNSVGRISANGIIRDATAHSVGSFDPDGTIRSKSGEALGKIVRLDILDAEGNRVGFITSDGSVRDGENNELGKVNLSDGKVTNAEQEVLGYARGIRVDWIACYYFFGFFDK